MRDPTATQLTFKQWHEQEYGSPYVGLYEPWLDPESHYEEYRQYASAGAQPTQPTAPKNVDSYTLPGGQVVYGSYGGAGMVGKYAGAAPYTPGDLQRAQHDLEQLKKGYTGEPLLGSSMKTRADEIWAAEAKVREIQQALAAAQGGGVAGSGTATGPGSAYDPQYYQATWYGFNDFDALEQDMYQQQLSTVSADFARRGLMSSSMYAAAADAAAANAQRARLTLEAQEMARHTAFTQAEAGRQTTWEQAEALRAWQEGESAANRQLAYQQLYAQQNAQQNAQRAQLDAQMRLSAIELWGSLGPQQQWSLLASLFDAWPGPEVGIDAGSLF